MSFTFDPYRTSSTEVGNANDVLLTNPTALPELESYWRSLPMVHGVPNRTDVAPLELGSLLEDCFILERITPRVARVRVAGRNVGSLLGIEPRGMPFSSFFNVKDRGVVAELLEKAFAGPSIVEVPLEAPRAIRQPKLDGKMMLLPLRDHDGMVTRVLGVLVVSGRRGVGGRHFTVKPEGDIRVEKVLRLQAVVTNTTITPEVQPAPVAAQERKKAKDFPALRLVVSNP